jgi:tetratricopeptide (TPR) repeat protein
MKFAQTLDILVLRAYADAYLGTVHLRRGELQQALHLAQRWLQTYAAAELPMPQLHVAENLGEVFNVSGHIDEAVMLFGQAWQFAESKSIFAHGPQVLALLGDAHGRAGRIDEAVETGQQALDLANQLGQRGDQARTLCLLGNIHGYGASANANQARERYQQALALAHELALVRAGEKSAPEALLKRALADGPPREIARSDVPHLPAAHGHRGACGRRWTRVPTRYRSGARPAE